MVCDHAHGHRDCTGSPKLQCKSGEIVVHCVTETFNYNKFKELVEILCKKRYDNNVLNILNILKHYL